MLYSNIFENEFLYLLQNRLFLLIMVHGAFIVFIGHLFIPLMTSHFVERKCHEKWTMKHNGKGNFICRTMWMFFFILFTYYVIMIWRRYLYIGPVLYSKNIIQTLLSFISTIFHSKPNILWKCMFYKNAQKRSIKI